MTIPVFINLGSNIDPERNLPQAIHLLRQALAVQRVSRVYRSLPLGADGRVLEQETYLNAAVLAAVEPSVTPGALKLRVLRPIEASLGRSRTSDRYAPRPVDLDLALFGDLVDSGLGIPDPEIHTRAHVALPLADLAPGFAHPITGETLAAIAAQFSHAPGIQVYPLTPGE
jgi:2-amino-4-hydroxy-6-hydroxymethyldihydropteridine diphosphokinase